MNYKLRFKIGDRVKVVRNSERILSENRIGTEGVVVGFKSMDCVIEFNNGYRIGIIQDDLELVK